ncbi:hypothetical protein ACFYNO_18640 [Kitasatospora sp. NPDC006697]|uniref:hypothetical protein n=1 Tax=Kitasatospora sp. NPDC006697 TaxID=3364020 RepID=UPI0036C2684F
MSIDFEPIWYATDLGDYRPSGHTYLGYPYASLPPLDGSRFSGAFDWLGDRRPGPDLSEDAVRIAELGKQLAAEGIELPADFITFHQAAACAGVLDEVSVTACWSSLSDPLPSPVEPGAFLVRFYRDQQDCLLWYLYLRPSGESFVVCSYLDYEYEYQARDSADPDEEPESDLDDADAQRAAIVWCAPTFEQFAYRCWLENRIWHQLHSSGGEAADRLDAEMLGYLAHYRKAR